MINRIITLCMFLLASQVFALDLELTQGINSALPIAINSFGSDSGAKEIGQIIENDLTFQDNLKLFLDLKVLMHNPLLVL